MLKSVEGERFLISLTSYAGDPGASSYEGFVEYARTMKFDGLYQLLRNAEPLSKPVQMHDPINRFRRYDLLKRFPHGLLAFGDSVCNFNPAYGQGMSVAALSALALQRCLQADGNDVARRFFQQSAAIAKVPWSFATGGDLQWQGVEGNRWPTTRVESSAWSGQAEHEWAREMSAAWNALTETGNRAHATEPRTENRARTENRGHPLRRLPRG